MNNAHRIMIAISGMLLVTTSGVVQSQPYFRGDVGYSVSRNADIKDKNFPVDRAICGNQACAVPGVLDDVGTSAILSGGVGWRFNPNIRVEGTAAYRGWYRLDDTTGSNITFKGDVKSWNFMVNGYYDFSLSWGKPYLGAGVGWASNKMSGMKATHPLFPGLTITTPGGTKNSTAWALMAGVGIPVNQRLTVDVGMRYADLGKLETDAGNFTASIGTQTATTGTYSGAKGNLRAWELTVGLRY